MADEKSTLIDPELVEDEQALDIRRPDVPITVEEIAALDTNEAKDVIEKRSTIIAMLRKKSILQTYPSDWVLFRDNNTGRVLAYLEDKGSQRLMDLWGIRITRVTTPQRQNSEDGTEYAYSIMGDGESIITMRKIESIEGVRYSTERYATEKPEGIQREVAVKKAARANLEGRIVRALAGLNGVPLEELVTVTGIKEFEQKASKGRGYGSQAERAGAVVQQAADVPKEQQPLCDQCTANNKATNMKFVPSGTSQGGKPYDAFWTCPVSRDHKTIKHADVLARTRKAAPPADQPREPGTEG